MRDRLVLVATAAALVGALVVPGSSTAQSEPPPVDASDAAVAAGEQSDQAEPSAESQRQVDEIGSPPQMRRVALPAIDDFRYDTQLTAGTAAEVCYGSLRTGTGWTFNELTRRFGGTPGSMYVCRERWDVQSNPNCNGQVINPQTNPSFYTDCWSNHAAGRALDIMVGTTGGGYNQARGNAIADWLLAPDADGNQNANARRLGVMQILWNDKCWNADGDRGVASAVDMRPCGIGHFDHVHIDMNLPGADDNVSFWGATPEPAPKLNGMIIWQQPIGYYAAQRWINISNATITRGYVGTQYDKIAIGDFDSDGVRDDELLYSSSTGEMQMYSWEEATPELVASGQWTSGWGELLVGDFDGDGFANDLFLRDVDSGYYQVHSWHGFANVLRSDGTITLNRMVVVGDWDADGRDDETFWYERGTGRYMVHTWQAWQPTLRRSGTFPSQWDLIVPGDWDSQGRNDDMFMWDAHTGRYAVYEWGNVSLQRITPGRLSMQWDTFITGDFDVDGRSDDMMMWDRHTGRTAIYSWRRSVLYATGLRQWSTAWTQFHVGTFG
ncbi:MAG: hypothetical protein ACK5OX_02085 [Desertimonas sp.]